MFLWQYFLKYTTGELIIYNVFWEYCLTADIKMKFIFACLYFQRYQSVHSDEVYRHQEPIRMFIKITRKSKTEAVLQRRSILKLGVICKFMNRYGKCFMS